MTKRTLPKAETAVRPGIRSEVMPSALSHWNPDVRAAAEDDDVATISIFDVIGEDFWGDGFTSNRMRAALRAIGERDVTVLVNSPGGNFFEGLAIYNLLREHPAAVTVKIMGLAASAASVIAMAGDEIQIARAGFLMIHNTWVVAMGDRNDFRDVADWLEPFDQSAVDIYAARTGLADDDLTKMLDRETWINGSSAVEQGFADALLPSDEIATAKNSADGRELNALRKYDALMSRAGVSKSERRDLLAALKGGMSGAAPTGMSGAAVIAGIEETLGSLKSLCASE